MAKKKPKKPAKVKVASYTRRFRPERLPPRDNKGKWRRRGPRQRQLFER